MALFEAEVKEQVELDHLDQALDALVELVGRECVRVVAAEVGVAVASVDDLVALLGVTSLTRD